VTEPLDMTNDPILTDDERTLEVIEDALGSLWNVANKLSRIRKGERDRFTVTVFGSARIKPENALYQQVKQLTKRLAELHCDIVTGGGPGLMQAANEGSQAGDPNDQTRSIGIRVALPFEKQANPFVEQVYTHQTFYTRLHQFVRMSNAFVIVGGGLGTTLELAMVWQLLQVKHVHGVPLILVGEMWRDLVAWAKKHMLRPEGAFANADDLDIAICVDSIEEALVVLTPRIQAFQDKRAKDVK
jgi:uncharacterized protein (TIGR00730 family)